MTVRVWDVASGEVLHILKGHSNGVNSVAFSRDGTKVVSGSGDKTVRVWDAISGVEVRGVEGQPSLHPTVTKPIVVGVSGDQKLDLYLEVGKATNTVTFACAIEGRIVHIYRLRPSTDDTRNVR
jgi:WD40 repeat protein